MSEIKNYSIEAEQHVLGALLMDASVLERIDFLLSKDFYDAGHGVVFQHIAGLVNSKQPVDIMTVAQSLADAGLITEGERSAIGIDYLASLQECGTSPANIKSYAGIVKKMAKERELMATLNEVMRVNTETRNNPIEARIDAIQAIVMGLCEDSQHHEDTISITDAMRELINDMQAKFESGAEFFGLSTGFSRLDEKIQGMRPGQSIIVAARPGMGKTSFSMQVAKHVMLEGKKVLVFSLEMPVHELTSRMVADVGCVPLSVVLNPMRMQEHNWGGLSRAFGEVNGKNMEISQFSSININKLRTVARRTKNKLNGLNLIVVDYIGLMQFENENRVQGLGEISRGLKLLAKELGCAIITLCQLNRKCEERADKRPILSDLRDSGEIEQDADIVLMIHNEAAEKKEDGLAEILIRKNRNGPKSTVPLHWVGMYTRFEHTDADVEYYSPASKKNTRDRDL